MNLSSTSESLLEKAMAMSLEERALIARCLIQSLEAPCFQSVEDQWLQLAQQRLTEMECGKVKPVGWDEIKNKITQ